MSFAFPDPSRALGAFAPQDIGVCTGVDRRLLSVNDAFERISGRSRDAILHGAVDASLLLPTEWQDDADTAPLSTHRLGFSRPYLRQLHRADGTPIDIIVVGAIAATAPLRWVCCIVDASALATDLGVAARTLLGLPLRERRGHEAVPRLVAESPLSAAAATPAVRPMLAAVLDAAPAGALLLNLRADAVHATPAACAVLGHSAAHFAGSRWRDLVHPEDLAQLDARLLLLLGGARADAAPPMRMRWRHASGLWRALHVQCALVPDAADCAAVLHLHDPSPVAEAEASAQLAEAVRHAVLAQMRGVVLVQFDLAMRCTSAAGDELTALCEVVGVSDAAELGQVWATPLGAVREGYDERWSFNGPHGASLHCTGTALRDRHGALTGVLLLVRWETASLGA